MAFEENIKKARIAAGYTQTEVADALGVTPAAVAQYELGGKVPNLKTGVRLAKMLGTTCEELVNGKDEKRDNGKSKAT